MPFCRLAALLLILPTTSIVAQGPPPAAILGEPVTPANPSRPLPFLDPVFDPLTRPLGPPDQPFRPFAPLGEPTNPLSEGIGTRFGLGVLAGRYGTPGYGVMWIPSQPVSGQSTELGVVRQELSIFAPIEHDGADTATIGLGIHNSYFYTNAVMPTSGRAFPTTWWDIEAGMAYSHKWDNGWTTGATVSVGSASDRPFSQGNVLVASVAMYNAFPTIGQDAWLLGFSYSPTSDFPYPLPIVSYYWKPSDDVEVNLGVPFFVKWRFLPEFTFDALYIPIRTLSAKVTWQPEDYSAVRVYGAFDWANDSAFLADRTENRDHFYSFEKRLAGGVQFDLIWRLRLDISAGYAFDRFFFEGKQYSDRNKDRINVGAGAFGALQLRLQF
jgi:hypothetical protein